MAALEAALAADRVPHAFIFCGPAGVGKALTARALAASLLCDAPRKGRGKASPPRACGTDRRGGPRVRPAVASAPRACGTCRECRQVARNSHPDLAWFRRSPEKSQFTIGVVTRRDGSPEGPTINESVQLKSMQARCRVTVIEDAEEMNASAANAFLKTFEEAPEGAYLVLLVTSLDRLLPTIRSRGRLVRFGALPDEFVAEILERDHGLSARDARALAPFADGGMDQAAALARSEFLLIRKEVLDALPRLGRDGALALADALGAWATDQARNEVQTKVKVEENHLRRMYLKRALAMLASVFRDALLVSAGGDGCGALKNADAADFVRRLAERVPTKAIERGVRRMVEYQVLVDRNVHNQLLLENACLEVSDLLSPARA